MSTGISLLHRAELAYAANRTDEAFDYYQRSIKKILKDEDVTALVPAQLPPQYPREVLGMAWHNFLDLFRAPGMNYTEASQPEAFKLLSSFRPSYKKPHGRFDSPQAQVLLKGMQITAALTLGLLAWDKRDRATAAKRYREAIDVSDSYPPFRSPPSGSTGLVLYVHKDLQTVQENLGVLVTNDALNVEMANTISENTEAMGRKDLVNPPFPMTRVDKNGEVTSEISFSLATNACAHCGKRDPKLQRCSLCRTTFCESNKSSFFSMK